MARPQFIVGDRVRVVTALHPEITRVGTIQAITPTPDNTGNLLYAIQVEGSDPTTAEILFVDSPRVLVMEYASGKFQTNG